MLSKKKIPMKGNGIMTALHLPCGAAQKYIKLSSGKIINKISLE